MTLAQQKWIEGLKAKGYKAAHPYDGWVNDVTKSVWLIFPYFNDGIKPGDKIMLGSPGYCLQQTVIAMRQFTLFSIPGLPPGEHEIWRYQI